MEVRAYSKIKTEKVEWFWYPYIPYGKITLIQGDPSEGKSSLILKLASIASNAGIMPNGEKLSSKVRVIYQCLEDGLSDTVKPRMKKNGADLSNVFFIEADDELMSNLNEETIENAICQTNAKLFVMDPVQTVLGQTCCSGSIGSVRRYLDALAGIANRTGCGIIMIGHLNKNEYGKDLYRGFGSIDVVASARSVLRVERIRRGSPVRIIRHIKSSLSREGEDYAFEIDDETGISWIGAVDALEEGEKLYEQARNGRNTKYVLMLKRLSVILQKEDLPYNEIFRKTRKIGCVRTLNEAKKELGIVSIKKSDGWYWHLPKEG